MSKLQSDFLSLSFFPPEPVDIKMAHKRPMSVHVDELKSFNLFSAFGADGRLKVPRPTAQDLESGKFSCCLQLAS